MFVDIEDLIQANLTSKIIILVKKVYNGICISCNGCFSVMSILFVNFFGCKFLNFDNLI